MTTEFSTEPSQSPTSTGPNPAGQTSTGQTSTGQTPGSQMPTRQTPGNGSSSSDGGAGAKAAVARVADEAPAQAARVVGDAKTQVTDAARRILDDLRTQAEDRTVRAAQGLRDLSTRADALASGRPEEAGNLADLAQSAGRHAQDFADRLDQRGVRGVTDDVSRFGRRHPMAFVGLALGAGFVVGRLVRTGAAVASEDGADSATNSIGSTPLPAPDAARPLDEMAAADVAEVRV